MKYYKTRVQTTFPNEERVVGSANGEKVKDAGKYFEKMEKSIITDAPVFDYFFLESYSPKKHWEWRLQDVHYLTGKVPGRAYWFLSDRAKELIELFYIAPDYHFYASKLLYKKEKLDYWVFQYPMNPFQNIVFPKSVFFYKKEEEIITIPLEDEKEHSDMEDELFLEHDCIRLECSKVIFNNAYDLVFSRVTGDLLVSQKLKTAIEAAGLEGFEFLEIDYQVEIDS